MKQMHAFAIAVAFSLSNMACAHAQPSATSTPTGSSFRTIAGNRGALANRWDAALLTRRSDPSAASMTARWISALVGMRIETPGGQRLGKVTDVLIDGEGRAIYAIVAYPGMLGLGDDYTAVPWETVAGILQRDRLVMGQAQLEGAPILSAAMLRSTDSSWRRPADRYWRSKFATVSLEKEKPDQAPVSLSRP